MKKPIEIPAPVKVSPLIKFFRYTLLIAGIFYGITKRKIYKAFADNQRARDAELAPERARKLQEEKDAAAERDLQAIIEIFRPKPKGTDVKYSHDKNEVKVQEEQLAQRVEQIEEVKTERYIDENAETCMTPFDGNKLEKQQDSQNSQQENVPQKSADNNISTGSTDIKDNSTEGSNIDTCDIYSKPIDLNAPKKVETTVSEDVNFDQQQDQNSGYIIEQHPEELMRPEENKDMSPPKSG